MTIPTQSDIKKREEMCCVYWIYTSEQNDIFTEGYVGISTTPDVRFKQHLSNARTDSHHKYPREFKEALLSGECVFRIILYGGIQYCLEIERKLRPYLYVGWNRAMGGDGGVVYKHGLTGSRAAKTYYNLIGRARQEGEIFYDGWVGEDGLENFNKFYEENLEKDGEFTTNEKGKGYNPTNLIKLPRSEIIRRYRRVYSVGDDNLYSVEELGEMFKLKPNTISTRMSRGWTTRQSCGLDPRPTRTVRIRDKEQEYAGLLNKEQLEVLKVEYESGTPLLHLEEKLSMSCSNLSRLVRRFGFNPPTLGVVECFDGSSFTLAIHSRLKVEDYETIKQLLLEGWPRYKIASYLGFSGSTLTECCKKLKWSKK